MQIVGEAIVKIVDILKISPSTTIRVADLGCSVGPNTFFAMENILEAIELKCQNQGLDSQIPEFQVFFNDFSTLFASLSPSQKTDITLLGWFQHSYSPLPIFTLSTPLNGFQTCQRSSSKQKVVARSSTEFEYRALAHTTAEATWLQTLLKELLVPSSVITLGQLESISCVLLSVFALSVKYQYTVDKDFNN